jgi:death-on-curing protein
VRLPTADILIELHDESIELDGGAPGVRDRGALDASLARADHLMAYAEPAPDAIGIASAICVSICRNHAFVDGNKRAALIALGVTLGLNDYALDAREADTINALMGLASNQLTEEEFTAWVRANAMPV